MAFIVKDMRRKNITVKGGDRTQIIDGSRPILSPIVFSRASVGTTEIQQNVFTTAAANEPRYEWVAGQRGLLIEPAATNLLLWSSDITTASWQKQGLTAQSNREILTANASHSIRQPVAVTPGQTYTFSFGVERGTMSNLKYSVYNNTASSDIIPPTSYFSQTTASGEKTISVTFTAPAGCTEVAVYALRDSGVTGNVYVNWQQFESGVVATSRISTTSGWVTRAADVPTIATAAFGFNASEGTFVAEYMSMNVSGSGGQASALFNLPGLASDRMSLFVGAGGLLRFEGVQGGSVQFAIDAGPTTAGVLQRASCSYASNYFAASENGVAAVVDLSGVVTNQISNMLIGGVAVQGQLNGVIFNLVYYPRKFTAAELQAATT